MYILISRINARFCVILSETNILIVGPKLKKKNVIQCLCYISCQDCVHKTQEYECNEITELHCQVFLINLILDCFLFIIFGKVQIDTSRLLGLFFFSGNVGARQKNRMFKLKTMKRMLLRLNFPV